MKKELNKLDIHDSKSCWELNTYKQKKGCRMPSPHTKLRIGTFRCWLFGHTFHGERVELDPHYIKALETGFISPKTFYGYHLIGFKTEYCTRCGIPINYHV